MFSGSPSEYLWEDAKGVVRRLPKAKAGRQGDPLMPLLFAVGQHGTLEASQHLFSAGERLFALLDDTYTVTPVPERVGPINVTLQTELWNPARDHGSRRKDESVELCE